MKLVSDLAKQQFWSEIGEASLPFFSYYKAGLPVVVAVSGGPDSMLSLVIVCSMVLHISGSLDGVVVVHCNHRTREATDAEQAFVLSFCEGLTCRVFAYQGEDYREHVLRAWRWECFCDVLVGYNSSLLITGHHLSDRIETSLLHLYRGCSVFGLSNMSVYEQKHGVLTHSSLAYSVYRPLLGLLKEHVVSVCEQSAIPFVHDPTNQDILVSKRNFIRHRVVSQLLHDSSFVTTMTSLYALIADYVQTLSLLLCLTPITISMYWRVDFAFLRDVPDRQDIDIALLVLLFKQLCRYCDSNEGGLLELCVFLRSNTCGWKVYAGTLFLIAHDRIYVFGADRCFWGNRIATVREITTFVAEPFGDFSLSITPDYESCVLRFGQVGDYYHGKRLHKYLLDCKVPIFWRNYVPVLVRSGRIVKVFLDVLKEQVVF